MDSINFSKTNRYFNRPRSGILVFFLIFFLAIGGTGAVFKFVKDFFSLGDMINYIIMGGAGFFVLIFFILLCTRGISDKYIDSVYSQFIERAKSAAYKNLGLRPEDTAGEPLVFSGCYFTPDKKMRVKIKRGKDSFLRSSAYEINVILHNNRQVYIYRTVVSIISDFLYEYSIEYFYKDIVSIGVGHEDLRISYSKEEMIDIVYERLELTTTGGTVLSCSMHARQLVDIHRQNINALREVIRLNKFV